MIKETLEALNSASGSLQDVARRLKITQDELRGRLDVLESHGYVEKRDMATPDCGGTCCGCNASCNMSDGMFSYYITNKGMRAIFRPAKHNS